MLSIVSISALFITTDASASKKNVLCIVPQSAYVYTEEDSIYTIAKDNDVFYTDKIEDGLVHVTETDLYMNEDDVIVGNDVISYLKKSNLNVLAKVCVDSAEVKPIGEKFTVGTVEKGTIFEVEDVSKYSVRILYDEEICYLKRSNVHLQYYLHDLEIPEYGLCETEEIIKNLDEASARLSSINKEVIQTYQNNDTRTALTEYALTFVGNQYIWGGTDPNIGADCSGFVGYVYRAFGKDLPRCSYQQCDVGTVVDRDTAQPGDLLFFWKEEYGRVGHVAMYLGNDRMVEAKSTKDGIVTNDVNWDKVYIARSYL